MELNTNNIIISNIDSYTISFYNNSMILNKKILNKLTLKELTNYDFKKSNIIDCKINNIKLDFKRYKPIIFYLYELINNIELVLSNTLLNIKNGKNEDRGFSYLEKLDISIQGVDANKSVQEIVNISKICNIILYIKIKLENNKIINL